MNKPTYEELESNAATQEHINLIRKLLRVAAVELLMRGEVHDVSKLSEAEAGAFARVTGRLRDSTYGTDEYQGFLKDLGPALRHHYAHNRHHPEHFPDGINGMNLFDVLEMFIDWMASSTRHANGSIHQSIDVGEKRFSMEPQLVAIFRNTARDFRIEDL